MNSGLLAGAPDGELPTRPRMPIATRRVLTHCARSAEWRDDRLATEEPMEIRVHGPAQTPVSVAVTMRTPGSDFELALGFLYTEGIISGSEDVLDVRYCEDVTPDSQQFNRVTVLLSRPFTGAALRQFVTSSSCGICGKASIDDLEVRCDRPLGGPVVAASAIKEFPRKLRGTQVIFHQTGALHAAALLRPSGDVTVLREDVGRHNAVDKLVGEALLTRRLPLTGDVLMVSGRVGFEIVQKAAAAGLGVLCAVSAPSSLAVEASERLGMTLIGFLRGDRFNIYTHPERVLCGF